MARDCSLLFFRTQVYDGGAGAAEMGARVAERKYGRQARQDRLHTAFHVANSFPMNDPHLNDPALAALFEVLRHEIAEVLRAERVQIENAIDRQIAR